jgi:hypothetical protein
MSCVCRPFLGKWQKDNIESAVLGVCRLRGMLHCYTKFWYLSKNRFVEGVRRSGHFCEGFKEVFDERDEFMQPLFTV